MIELIKLIITGIEKVQFGIKPLAEACRDAFQNRTRKGGARAVKFQAPPLPQRG